ncbi:uncharacterized protein C9orf40 homolog [Sorex araneus]|uniref:uncharacterized protein C9orf40 homolog n=1 Tax=Sorex araneus TaxID=42254 RepID=UPI00243345F8|nr:uncharacterized protein C9orf40 homolog [Sorex araneus]
MAKRRAAAPLTLHVPCKRPLLRDAPEAPPGVAPAGPPRKRRADAGAMTDPAASPSKRRGGGGDPRGPPLPRPGPGEPPRGAPGGGDSGAGRGEPPRGAWGAAPRQPNEEFWQYNTFQYWRNPLPPLDLADIEAVSEDNLAKAKLPDKSEEVEIDMES